MEAIDHIESHLITLEHRRIVANNKRNALLNFPPVQADLVRLTAQANYAEADVAILDNAIVEKVTDGYWVEARVWVPEAL